MGKAMHQVAKGTKKKAQPNDRRGTQKKCTNHKRPNYFGCNFDRFPISEIENASWMRVMRFVFISNGVNKGEARRFRKQMVFDPVNDP